MSNSDWIDISVTQPENNQKVLVCAGDIVAAAIADTEFWGDGTIFLDGCGLNGYEWGFEFKDSDVTHWMPLHEPFHK